MLCSAVIATAILCARRMCCRCAVCSDCLTVRPFSVRGGVVVWLLWLSRLSLSRCMRKGSARFIPCRAFCVCPSMNFRRVWFQLLANPYPLPLFFGRCVGVRCSRACGAFGFVVCVRSSRLCLYFVKVGNAASSARYRMPFFINKRRNIYNAASVRNSD